MCEGGFSWLERGGEGLYGAYVYVAWVIIQRYWMHNMGMQWNLEGDKISNREIRTPRASGYLAAG